MTRTKQWTTPSSVLSEYTTTLTTSRHTPRFSRSTLRAGHMSVAGTKKNLLVSTDKMSANPMRTLSRRTTKVSIETNRKLPSGKTEGPERPSRELTRLSHLDLTVPARRKDGSRRQRRDINRAPTREKPEGDSIFDSDDEETIIKSEEEWLENRYSNRGKKVYKYLCKKLRRLPVTSIIKQLGGTNELYANDDTSKKPKTLEKLCLDGNRIITRQIHYVIDIAQAHKPLTDLQNASIQELVLRGNKLEQSGSRFGEALGTFAMFCFKTIGEII
ncbi:hypothetical protein MAR_022305 [Mya arenaria]|uniref:Uncharacterized protein n=1 Tax=Mya arenaria TaxID=6604 RepID=A0ABY7DJP3_MYAAR|nr:hypothetical protein MAR_022305 [Mya arenaria]